MVFAWENRSELPTTLSYGSAWERDYRAWADQSYSQVQGSLACVPGDIVHLYHGTRANRRYVERYQIFHDHAYDPVGDVEIDPLTGLLQWSAHARETKPDMVRRVAEYFHERREDD